MNATRLFFAPGTSKATQELAETIPPYDLLNAYREARIAFNTTDIVLILAVRDGNVEGFVAKPRGAYVEEAFGKWSPAQRKIHPLCRESAHKKVSLPAEMPAFWLVIQAEDKNAVICCAIGTHLEQQTVAS